MRVGVLGVNHKLANLSLRELLAKACQRCFAAGAAIHHDHTFVLLNTCNRTEIYFSSHDLADAHSYLLQILRQEVDECFDQKVYSYFGHDCFLHLSRVTAGLDSAIIAETEIQGQVKAAYERANASIQLSAELHYLFQKVLKIGKQVRAALPMGRGMPDLEHAIFHTGTHFFEDSLKQASILFVGASDVNCKVLSFLKSKNLHQITLCNRSEQRARAIAATYQLETLHWNRFTDWHRYDWIIFGTKAPYRLIQKQYLPSCCNGQKLIMDLCVPRNVEPKLGKDPRVTLLNIDQINRILKVRKLQMAHMIDQAELLIAKSAQEHLDLYHHKQSYKPQCA